MFNEMCFSPLLLCKASALVITLNAKLASHQVSNQHKSAPRQPPALINVCAMKHVKNYSTSRSESYRVVVGIEKKKKLMVKFFI